MSFIPWWVHYPNVNNEILNLDWLLKVSNCNTHKIENFINLNTIKYADPILWNIESQYEANTVVVDGQTGNAYISTKAVPSGVHLNRTEYWTQIYNYADELSTLRSQIAFDEGNTTTASRVFGVDDLVFINDKLYRVIAPMIAGDSFVEDSNIKKTIINDELTRLRIGVDGLNQELDQETSNRESADDYLHGLIDDEVNNRESADNYLHDLINPNKRNYLFVGDSYAAAHYAWEPDVKGWPEFCKDYLHLTDSQYLATLAGATGFCTPTTWYSMLDSYTPPEGVEVTDIVIGGGYNDKDYNITTILNAIDNVATLIRTKFPFARVWLTFMGWSCDDNQWQGMLNAKSAYIIGAGANGWNYIANVDLLGHNYTDGQFYTTTGPTPFGSNFHPNNNGNRSIARAISTCVRGGQFEDYDPLTQCDLDVYSYEGNSVTPSYEQLYTSHINNNMSIFSKHIIEANYTTPISVTSNGTLYPIGMFTSGRIHGDANEQTIGKGWALLQNTNDSNLVLIPVDIILKSNVMFIRSYEISNNTWNTYENIFRIQIQLFETIGVDRTRI